MGESTPGRCGYEWPADCDRADFLTKEAVHQSCCFRETANSSVDYCIWHADIKNVGEKTAKMLVEARAPEEIRKQNKPVSELLDGAILPESILNDLTLSNTALRGANLKSVDLRTVDLTTAKLHGANLIDADLRGADLADADLRYSELNDIDLWQANLTGTDFRKVDLTNAQIQDTNLTGANFWDANLDSASLRNSDLTTARLTSANLTDADLRQADLTKAVFREANLSDTDLWDADLIDADFREASLTDANLRESNLTDADLRDANLTDANLTDADLVGQLERANLTRTNLFGANLRGADFYGAITTDTQINEGTKFGDHYMDHREVEKAAWCLSQIEKLSRQNALPDQIREAFTKRKDRRRKYYWQHSNVPDGIRSYARYIKKNKKKLFDRLNNKLQNRVNNSGSSEIQINQSNIETNDHNTASNEMTSTGSKSYALGVVLDSHNNNIPDPTNYERYVNTTKWAWLALSGTIMRYGESARRVVTLSLLTILAFGVAYPFVGGIEDGGTIYTVQLTSEPSLAGLVTASEALLRNLYFSTITFTTIGYANVAPAGPWSRLLVGIESFAGALLMALLVFVLGRRSTR